MNFTVKHPALGDSLDQWLLFHSRDSITDKVVAKKAVVAMAMYICTFSNTTLFQNEQRDDDAPLPQLVSTKGPKIKHQVAPVTTPKFGATVEVI